MKDAFENDLKIGDVVFFVKCFYDDRFDKYQRGTIIKFTNNFACIDYFEGNKLYHTKRISRRIILDKSKEATDNYLRLVADMDNYKKNIEKRGKTMSDIGRNNVLINYIEFLDDLRRAMDETGDCEGLNVIYNKNINILRSSYNLVSIDEYLGEENMLKFNPDYHEAIMNFPIDNKEKDNIICMVQQKGYIFKDGKLLRPQKVVVYKYQENA